jgi:hypothetical protein
MKNNLVIRIFIILFVANACSIYPWGDKGHKLISKKAVEFYKRDGLNNGQVILVSIQLMPITGKIRIKAKDLSIILILITIKNSLTVL